ncbi:MAG: DUF2892 domain-containing protein [Candidatus Margulisbacteria bacterium]|nr:DUF2892 domain-containing protein [Candidatus Margulisiibacteriota bacterium]
MEIKKNENIFDRFVKMLIGGIVLFFAFYLPLHLIFVVILLFAALWLIVTGLLGYCPLYNLLGINTHK